MLVLEIQEIKRIQEIQEIKEILQIQEIQKMKEIQKIKEVQEIKICPYSMISCANFKKGEWLSDIANYTDAIASKNRECVRP